MSEYKRWISYIYYYDNGEKKNNIGYARAETRGAKTKITVHINVLSVALPMETYLLIRKDGTLKGIPLGQIAMDKGVGHGVYNTDTNNIEGTGYGIADIDGLLIMCNKEKFYASEWKDNPISIEGFEEYKMNDEEKSDREKEILGDIPEPEQGQKEEKEEETAERDEDIRPAESAVTEVTDRIQSDVTDGNEISVETATTDKIKKTDKTDAADTALAKAAEKMLEDYPPMYPFEDDEMIRCVRIEPQDIGRLPIDTWVLVSNSFLLQGFYGYRHLILMKRDDNRSEYLIGVPGVYHNRENFLAKMFGFNEFKPMRRCDNLKDTFGYWCILLSEVSEGVVTGIFS